MSEKCRSRVVRPGYSRTMVTRPPSAPAPQYVRRVDSPIGRIEVTSDGSSVTSLSIEKSGTLPWDDLPERSNRILERAARQLAEYFSGKRHTFDLPLSAAGTEFQKSVWSQLSGLEWGEYTTYGELGLATGRPTAGRAVGGAVGANPLPIIVPCHRVLASNGKITGYSGGDGIPTKVWLLQHEGITHVA
ncbi:MAG: methylated-DNA--[protein]-cysteine S-methyltransferase [Glaciihabitans sp.]|nr:methylated-DNA--[protein]-cysteine S-methyltransferase [Glaciihabitans sp.]